MAAKLDNPPLHPITRALFEGLAEFLHHELCLGCHCCRAGTPHGNIQLTIHHPREVPPGSHRPPFRGAWQSHHESSPWGPYGLEVCARFIYGDGKDILVLNYDDRLLDGPIALEPLYYTLRKYWVYDLKEPNSFDKIETALRLLWLTQDIPPKEQREACLPRTAPSLP